MDAETAQTTVKVMAVLHYISAAFSLLFGMLVAVMLPFLAEMVPEYAELFTAFGIAIAVLFVLMAILDVLIGYGLWKFRSWGRILLLITYWILAAAGALLVVVSLVAGDVLGAVFNLFLWVGMSAVLIWLFQFQQDIVALFREA